MENFNNVMNIEDIKKLFESNESTEKKTYSDLPAGSYEVAIDKLEFQKENQWGNASLNVTFKILVGDYEGRLMFYTQNFNTGYGVRLTKDFLNSLKSSVPVVFEDYDQFTKLVEDIKADITPKHEYLVELSYQVSKGKSYKNYKITKVYDI